MCIFGLAVLIFALTGNSYLAGALFFFVLGISLVIIGISEPVLPLVILFSVGLIFLGLFIYGTFIALFNPVIIIGLMIIVGGGAGILFIARSGIEK